VEDDANHDDDDDDVDYRLSLIFGGLSMGLLPFVIAAPSSADEVPSLTDP
jgi:hypothetical protein